MSHRAERYDIGESSSARWEVALGSLERATDELATVAREWCETPLSVRPRLQLDRLAVKLRADAIAQPERWSAQRLELMVVPRADGRVNTRRRLLGVRPNAGTLEGLTLRQPHEHAGADVQATGPDGKPALCVVEPAGDGARRVTFAAPWSEPVEIAYEGLSVRGYGGRSGLAPWPPAGSYSYRPTVRAAEISIALDLSAGTTGAEWRQPEAYLRAPNGSSESIPLDLSCDSWEWHVRGRVARLELAGPVLGLTYSLAWVEVS